MEKKLKLAFGILVCFILYFFFNFNFYIKDSSIELSHHSNKIDFLTLKKVNFIYNKNIEYVINLEGDFRPNFLLIDFEENYCGVYPESRFMNIGELYWVNKNIKFTTFNALFGRNGIEVQDNQFTLFLLNKENQFEEILGKRNVK
jgi:hypothetical protein